MAGAHIAARPADPKVPVGLSGGLQIRLRTGHRVIVLLAACLLLGAGPVRAADQQVARDVLANQDYQTSLPAAGAPRHNDNPQTPSTGQNPTANQDHQSTPPDSTAGSADLPPDAANGAQGASATTIALVKLIPTVVLILFALLLLYFGLRAFQRRRRATAPREEQRGSRPETPATFATAPGTGVPAAAISPEWQLLADQGRFNDAIHILLLHVLGQLRHNHLLVPAISQTGREILRMKNLPETHRPGLSTIIGAVEFCHFGGRAAGPQLYQHCVDAYQQISTTPVAR